jgi:hypothetical protein
MPLRDYECPDGHITTDLISGDFPRERTCTRPDCGKRAAYRLSVPARGIVTGSTNPSGLRNTPTRDGYRVLEETDALVVRQKGDAPTLVDWLCPDGHAQSEVYDTAPTTGPACPTCGKATTAKVGVPSVDWFTAAGYHMTGGYYDNGLGCWITSIAHRKQVMAQQGLQEGSDDYGDTRRQVERKLRADAEDEVVREMLQDCEHGPEAAETKKMRDQGLVPDWRWAVEQVGGLDGP